MILWDELLNIDLPKCALASITFFASNSIQNHGSQKLIMPMSQHKEF